MKFPTDLAAIQADPRGFAEAVFGNGGLAASMMPGHRENAAQLDYATNLLRAGLLGTDPATAGRVTFLEASTGTGKTIAYLVVGLTLALATGRRLLVSTYTRQLMFQVAGGEGDLAFVLVRRILGIEGDAHTGATGPERRVAIVPRRSRSAFVSPSRARASADKLRREGKHVEAVALDAYAALAEDGLARAAAGAASAMVDELDGLIEAFDALDPERADVIRAVPTNDYVLDRSCPEAEQLLWKAYQEAARTSVGLVVTHAALLIDMSMFGRLTNGTEDPYILVIVDEAHDLHKAASAAFGAKLSLRGMALEARKLVSDLDDPHGPLGGGAAQRAVAIEAAARYAVSVAALHEAIRDFVDLRDEPDLRSYAVRGHEPWLVRLEEVHEDFATLVAMLRRIGTDEAKREATELAKHDQVFNMFFDVVEWRRENAPKTGLYIPTISLSPRREDPSLQVVPVKGERIMSRMWLGRGDPMGNAIVFTSATLATPGKTAGSAFLDAAWSYGIDDRVKDVNVDLCGIFEPRSFGSPSFVFADRQAPFMTSPDKTDGRVTPNGARYAALAIQAAAGMPNTVTGRARQVVLTKSFEDAARVVEEMDEAFRGLVVLREKGTSLRAAVAAWRAVDDGILVTPGAHEGLNEPGLIDHLHVFRLPYDPPAASDGRENGYYNARAEMITTLRQALGRAVRRAADCPTIWLLDPRIPLPERVARMSPGPTTRLKPATADNALLAAIPARWADRVNRGTVFGCPIHLRRDAAAKPPADEGSEP